VGGRSEGLFEGSRIPIKYKKESGGGNLKFRYWGYLEGEGGN